MRHKQENKSQHTKDDKVKMYKENESLIALLSC